MTSEEAIKMLKTEKACVERQERKQNCNRYCESCDLCMPIEDVIEGYNMAIKALEQKSRDCKTCIHSYKGNCAGTEECHECMWESKYDQTDGDLIYRNYVINMFNTMDRYKADKLILQDTDREFPSNEVFIVDDCYELLEQLPTYSAEQTAKEDTAENLHREKEQAYYKGFEDGRKMLLDRMKEDTAEMNDLIPRQAVITMLQKIENAVEDGDGFQFNEWIEYAKQIPSFENMASWVELDDYPCEDWECKHCGFVITGVEEPYRFCPNCGKKMWK